MEHTAKVDMLLSCKLTPKNFKSYRKNGRTNREKSTASYTEELSGNHAKRWTWSVKDLESWMVSLRPFQALSILLTATIIMMTAGKCIHIQQSAWEKWSNGGRKLDITSSNARIIRLKVSCPLTNTKTIQPARKLSEFNSQALIAWDTDYSYSYVAILYDTMRLKIFSYFLIL